MTNSSIEKYPNLDQKSKDTVLRIAQGAVSLAVSKSDGKATLIYRGGTLIEDVSAETFEQLQQLMHPPHWAIVRLTEEKVAGNVYYLDLIKSNPDLELYGWIC